MPEDVLQVQQKKVKHNRGPTKLPPHVANLPVNAAVEKTPGRFTFIKHKQGFSLLFTVQSKGLCLHCH